jgi:hypothetical protein
VFSCNGVREIREMRDKKKKGRRKRNEQQMLVEPTRGG